MSGIIFFITLLFTFPVYSFANEGEDTARTDPELEHIFEERASDTETTAAPNATAENQVPNNIPSDSNSHPPASEGKSIINLDSEAMQDLVGEAIQQSITEAVEGAVEGVLAPAAGEEKEDTPPARQTEAGDTTQCVDCETSPLVDIDKTFKTTYESPCEQFVNSPQCQKYLPSKLRNCKAEEKQSFINAQIVDDIIGGCVPGVVRGALLGFLTGMLWKVIKSTKIGAHSLAIGGVAGVAYLGIEYARYKDKLTGDNTSTQAVAKVLRVIGQTFYGLVVGGDYRCLNKRTQSQHICTLLGSFLTPMPGLAKTPRIVGSGLVSQELYKAGAFQAKINQIGEELAASVLRKVLDSTPDADPPKK